MSKKKDFISIVIVAEELIVSDFLPSIFQLYRYLDDYFIDYEIIFVENVPNIINREELKSLLKKVPSIRFIELSYKIDYEIAVTVGLENSIGDFAIILNPLQDPLNVIIPMVEKCSQDGNVVIGVANNVESSVGYKIIRPLINFILKEIEYHIPRNATTLRCISRNAINSATKARNYHHQIFIRIAQCGIDSFAFIYDLKNPKVKKKKLIASAKYAIRLLIINSVKPLRWMSALGIFGSFFAFIFACYSFLMKLINHNIADGWSSTVILISMLFMLLFIILTFFGEYLGRILNDNSKHEQYWILNEFHSSVMVNQNRQNVISRSEYHD